jgi:hypothetical protein
MTDKDLIKKAAAGWEEVTSGGSPKEETLMSVYI